MSSQRGSPDDQFVNINDCDELRYWTSEFQTTPDQLKTTVAKVGNSVSEVRAYLKLHNCGQLVDISSGARHSIGKDQSLERK